MSEDSLARVRRGASRMGKGLSGLLGQVRKTSSPSSPGRRSKRRRKAKISGSETYRSFLKSRFG